MIARRWLLALAGCLALCGAAQAFEGVVTRVSDGDTLWVRPDGAKRAVKVRLEGIDAPERCQAWGAQAQVALASRVLNQRVHVRANGRDDYNRILGSLERGGEDITAWMVREGHAWNYRSRRSPGPYASQEQEARALRRGLFADSAPVEPRVFRHTRGPCP